LDATADEQRVRDDQERRGPILSDRRKCRIDLATSTGGENIDLQLARSLSV
jgi:hypothetical protein